MTERFLDHVRTRNTGESKWYYMGTIYKSNIINYNNNNNNDSTDYSKTDDSGDDGVLIL